MGALHHTKTSLAKLKKQYNPDMPLNEPLGKTPKRSADGFQI